MIKYFKWDIPITILGLIAGFLLGGVNGLVVVTILILLEISMSFDNATVNAKYIEKLSQKWRKIFLTVGVLIAVFGMRLIFPFLIVSLTGGVNFIDAIHLAFEKGDPNTPGTYGYILEHAHPLIASFGGMFLLMLFLNFIFDEEKDSHWLNWIEKPLSKAGQFSDLATVTSLSILSIATYTLTPEHEKLKVLTAGVLGIITFIITNGLATFMEAKNEEQESKLSKLGETTLLTGKAALSMFLFLEVLDASFSFDGVLGAFAITTDPIIIAIGLGVGALFVRSLTILLVDKGTLNEFEYLEHGAHWAIGVLALMLLITIKWEIPDYIIGLSGMLLIGLSLYSSIKNKNIIKEKEETEEKEHYGLYNNFDKE